MTRRILPYVYLAAAGFGGIARAGSWAWAWAAGLLLLAWVCWRAAPRAWPVITAAMSAAVFLGWSSTATPVDLGVASLALVFVLALGPNIRWRLVTAAMVAVPVTAVGAIILRDQWMAQAHTLVALATGLTWGAGTFWTLWDRRQPRSAPGAARLSSGVPGEIQDRPLLAAFPRLGTRSQWHGWTLVVTAAALPLGEGVTFAAAGTCLVMLLVRRRHVAAHDLLAGDCRRVVLGFGVWIGMALLASILSGHFLLETRELGRLGPFVLMPLVFLSVSSLPPEWLDRAARTFFISLVVACLVAIGQFGLNQVEHPIAEGLAAWLMKSSQSRVPGTVDDLVAGGFFRHRLKMAHVVMVGIVILVGRQLLVNMSRKQRLIEGGASALYFATLLLTFTRGAVLGVAAAVAVAIWTGARRWRLRAVAVVVVFSLGALAVPSVRARVASIGSRSTGSDRAFIWAMSAQIAGDHRLGIGLANYPTYSAAIYDAAESPFKFVPRTYPHSLVMAAWAEAGPVGLGGYVAIWMALAVAAVAGLRRREDPRTLSAASALLLLVSAYWVLGITHDVLFHKPVALTFSAVVGATLAQLRPRSSQA